MLSISAILYVYTHTQVCMHVCVCIYKLLDGFLVGNDLFPLPKKDHLLNLYCISCIILS